MSNGELTTEKEDPSAKTIIYVNERADRARNEALKVLGVITTVLTLATGFSVYFAGKKDLSDALKTDPIKDIRVRAEADATKTKQSAQEAANALRQMPARIQTGSVNVPKDSTVQLRAEATSPGPNNVYKGHVAFSPAFKTAPKVTMHFTRVQQGIWTNQDVDIGVKIAAITPEGFDFEVRILWLKYASLEWLAFGE